MSAKVKVTNMEELITRLDEIVDSLPNYSSEVASEQVEYNKELEVLLAEVETYENEVNGILKHKVDNMRPESEDGTIDELYVDSEHLRMIIKLLGKDEEFVERFGFDRTIYEIGHAESVDILNNTLKNFIRDMKGIGIVLKDSDFNYSIFSSEYMKYFFENYENPKYLFNMKKVFDDIYWECPTLLTHIELSVRNIVLKNKKNIVKHINALIAKYLKNLNLDKEDVISEYVKVRTNFDDLKMCDEYNLYLYFKENFLELDYYNELGPQFESLVSSVTSFEEYQKMNDEEKKLFFSYLKDLKYELREFFLLEKYKRIFKYIDTILNKTDNNKGAYNSKVKEISKMESTKNKLDSKIKGLISKRDKLKATEKEKINDLNVKIKQLYNELDSKVVDIKKALDEATQLHFEDSIRKNLNKNSNLYDVACLFSKYYGILTNEMATDKKLTPEDVSLNVDEFRHIQYNAHLTIMKSVVLSNIDTVKELIEKKFNLYKININIPVFNSEDYNTLKKNVNMLVRYNELLSISLTPDDLKVLIQYNEE